MYIEEPSQIYGCWRCGKVMGDVVEDCLGNATVCGDCGEHTIMTFLTALDLINDLFVIGVLEQESINLEDYYEE